MRADDHGVRGGARIEDVQRGRRGHADALALAGREPPEAVVLADRLALLVDDMAGARLEPVAGEERPIVVTGEETGLLALCTAGDGETCARCFGPGRVLVLLAERKPDPVELLRIEAGEHVRLVLRLVGGAMQEQAAAMLGETSVVTRRETVAAGAPGEREELREAEAAVAPDARVRRLAPLVPAHERRHDRSAKFLTQVEGHMRQAQPVACLARCDHRLGGAACSIGVRPLGVEPEAKRHPDRVPARPEQCDRAVDAAAHRDSGASRLRRGAEDRPERVCERIGRQCLAANRRSLEQCEPDDRPLEARRIRFDDAVAVHA